MKKNIAILAIANFVTAFGGGTVLGKAIGVVSFPFADMGSLIAFFFGTAFGLFLLFTVLGNHHHRNDIVIAFLGSLCSLTLLYLFQKYADIGGKLSGFTGLLFFVILCLRFAFWFLSRILRSDRMSGGSPKAVPLIEGLFHSGTILSLLAIATGILALDLVSVFILDSCSQLAGAFFDLVAKRDVKKEAQDLQVDDGEEVTGKPYDKTRLIYAIIAFSITTVMIQVVLFHIAHLSPEKIGAGILASFYFGLAIAGLLGAYFSITYVKRGRFGGTHLGTKRKLFFPNWSFILISTASVLFVILFQIKWLGIVLISLFTFLASIFYEIFEFSLLDVVADEGRNGGLKRMVAKTFGVMAVVACISMFCLRLVNPDFQQSAVVVIILFALSMLVIYKMTRGLLHDPL